MITYDYYRIFYFVARYHSFSRAAELLNNSQPNITRCMNILEHELGCKLFARSNRGIRLTPEGEGLFIHVAAAYEQLQLGEQELQMNRSLECGYIAIGASETALRLCLLNQLEVFREDYPNIQLRICNQSSPQAIAALENGSVDFAVVTTPFQIKKTLCSTPLFSFREILLGGRKYRELTKSVYALNELADYPFVSLGDHTGTRELYIQYFLNHGLSFHPRMEASTADQILPMILHNLGIGFYPEELAGEALRKEEVFPIRIQEEFPVRQVCLITEKDRPKSIAVQKLLEKLRG